MTRPVSLTVNGRSVEADVEPRMHLADLVRDTLHLTGTHLGCEHGVCGACTILVDGVPTRSCIAYAIACDGADVRTIEGFDDDSLMQALRQAFTHHHALQCGYCTPGMLITAHDIVRRLPDADESRVREELSGNLCRCTGYVGIVEAVRSVLANPPAHRGELVGAVASPSEYPYGTHLRPSLQGSSPAAPTPDVRSEDEAQESTIRPRETPRHIKESFSTLRNNARRRETQVVSPVIPASAPSGRDSSSSVPIRHRPDMSTPIGSEHQITISIAPDALWPVLQDVATVVRCLPGASLTGPPTANPVSLGMTVAIGPMKAQFAGTAYVAIDARRRTATIHGSGHDARSRSTSHGRIELSLRSSGTGGSIVTLRLHYTLKGPLAQFGRGMIVDAVVEQILEQFAANLASAAKGEETDCQPRLRGLSLAAGTIRRWLRRWVGSGDR